MAIFQCFSSVHRPGPQMPSQSEAASDTAATQWLRLGLLRPGAMLHAVELSFQELVEHQAGRRPTCGPILERTAAVLVNRIQVQVAS
ncbi:unnamed protein product [Cladocopium goreaui]|uniref:Uncharacterized protein n=1 Tax=Cladocopium goreaui TaxID=2562237 RepID=A0A9P1CIE4_9DINO|nr:unnamed protein product [Cladocopium goreaui]